MQIIERAWADTKVGMGEIPSIIGACLSPFVAIAIQASREGVVNLGWASAAYGVAGFAAFVLLIFLFNLIAAPMRLEREHRIRLEKLNAEQAEKLREGPRFSGKVHNIWHGGADPQWPADQSNIVVTVTVANQGTRASAVPVWWMEVRNGESVNTFNLTHVEFIELGVPGHGRQKFFADGSIGVATREPIEPGAYRQGWALAIVPRAFLSTLGAGTIISLVGTDIFGGEARIEYMMRGDGEGSLTFYPAMKQEWKPDDGRAGK